MERKRGNGGCWSWLWPHFFTGAASFWSHFTVQQGQATDVAWPKPSPEEQQVKHCSKVLQRTVPAAFPSLPFQKDISQTKREKSSCGCSPQYPGEKRWMQLKHDFACWNLLSQEQEIKFHSWVFFNAKVFERWAELGFEKAFFKQFSGIQQDNQLNTLH